MAEFATYRNMQEWGGVVEAKESVRKAAASIVGKTTFMSHSTADDDLVAGAVRILENHGGRVYVDHRDPQLAAADCVAIANDLRKTIRECRRFVMLATPRSKDSKWIPWELGLGDGIHGESQVALFPSAENAYDQSWAEREYLSLYRRIVFGRLAGVEEHRWFVLNHIENTGIPLADWLNTW